MQLASADLIEEVKLKKLDATQKKKAAGGVVWKAWKPCFGDLSLQWLPSSILSFHVRRIPSHILENIVFAISDQQMLCGSEVINTSPFILSSDLELRWHIDHNILTILALQGRKKWEQGETWFLYE